jgi:hypothetical protein
MSTLCLGCWSNSSETRTGAAGNNGPVAAADPQVEVATTRRALTSFPATASLSLRQTAGGIVPTVSSNKAFPVMNSSFVLIIGSKVVQLNYLDPNPDTNGKVAVFHAISEEEFQALPDGASVSVVGYHGRNLGLEDFEALDKSQLEVE